MPIRRTVIDQSTAAMTANERPMDHLKNDSMMVIGNDISRASSATSKVISNVTNVTNVAGPNPTTRIPPNALLASLEANYHATHGVKRNCVSVRDCLRSKTVPHPKVKKLLAASTNAAQSISLQDLQQAFKVLQQFHLAELAQMHSATNLPPSSSTSQSVSQSPLATPPSPCNHSQSTSSSKQQQNERSSLYFLSQTSTIIRFLQLLLELRKLLQQQPQQQSLQLSSLTSNTIQPQELPILDHMAVSLLKQLSKIICTNLQQEQSKSTTTRIVTQQESNSVEYHFTNADTTTECSARHIAMYAFASLLRLNQSYAQGRPQLAGPLWKALCDMVSAFGANHDPITQLQQQHQELLVPLQLMEQAMEALLGFCKEGYHVFLQTAMQVLQVTKPKSLPSKQNLDQQGKLVGFLVARLVILMSAVSQSNNTASFNPKSNQNGIVLKCMRCLLQYRGLPMATFILHQEQSMKQQSPTTSSYATMLQILMELSTRIEKHMISMLVRTASIMNSDSSGINATPTCILQLQSGAINHLLHTRRPKASQKKDSPLQDQLSILSWSLGKALLLRRILAAASTTPLPSFVHFQNDTVECLLSVTEHLLGTSLAECQTPLLVSIWTNSSNTGSDDGNSSSSGVHTNAAAKLFPSLFLISSSIQHAVKLLLGIGEWHSPKMLQSKEMKSKFCRLLIAWLGRFSDHPLSRELSISVLHLYIVFSNQNKLHGRGSGSGGGGGDFTAVLIRLFWDSHASTKLRESIGALILRLLNSTKAYIREHVRDGMHQALLRFCQTALATFSAKRKRSTSKLIISNVFEWNQFSIDDWDAILFVVSSVPKAMSSTTKANMAYTKLLDMMQALCKDLPAFVSAQHKWGNHIAGQKVECVVLLLAGLPGLQFGTDVIKTQFQLDTFSIYSSILTLLFQVNPKSNNNKKDKCHPWSTQRATVVTDAIMCAFICLCSDENRAATIPISKSIDLLSTILDNVEHQTIVDEKLAIRQRLLQFNCIDFLNEISKAIPESCSKEDLHTLVRLFTRMLSSKSRPIVACSMSAYECFGEHLFLSHRHILRACLPSAVLAMFQCRFGGFVWHGNLSLKLACPGLYRHLVIDKAMLSHTSTSPQSRGKSIFPSPALAIVQPDSYVFEISLSSGLKATVVLPPDPRCLKEIENMTGMAEDTDDEPPQIRLLRRCVTQPNGGCKFILQQPQI